MVPVMLPSLPTAEILLPYLQRIDESHWYSNFGPLYLECLDRLASYFDVETSNLLLVANGTLALQAAISTVGFEGDTWGLPSWTFAATGHAVVAARRTPHFVDVEPDTWCMSPNAAARFDGNLIVSPFGDRPRVEQWGCVPGPKVFDAASCFDSCAAIGPDLSDEMMVMISMHATKALPAGEGAILIGPKDWIRRAQVWSNFGFSDRRVADFPGSNAKLSEYHCAVALASMDGWADRLRYERSRIEVALTLTESLGLQSAPGFARGFASNTWNITFSSPQNARVAERELESQGFETRRWWPVGLHEMEAFRALKRDRLSVTERLAATTLGLPFGPHVTEGNVWSLGAILEFASR